jgi:hypothetical protein
MDTTNEILKEIDSNAEMALLQGQKIIESVDGLEPALDGILLTNHNLLEEAKKTNEKLDEKSGIEINVSGESMSFYKGEKGDKGDMPEINYEYIIDEVTKRILKMEE